MRALTFAATGFLLVLVGGCSVEAPVESLATSESPTPVEIPTPVESRVPDATRLEPSPSPPIAEPGDPAALLAGRAVAGLGAPGIDVVFRIGAEGFPLPEDEFILDIYGDRVLSARRVDRGLHPSLVVRDLEGQTIHEIDPGMQVPQTAIVRGDDVYFAGIDVTYDADGAIDALIDRGVWVAHGNCARQSIYAPESPVVYSRMQLSPDEQTVGFTRCDDVCATVLVGRGSGAVVEVPRPELIVVANDVALVIAPHDESNQVIAFAIADGTELWRAVDGLYLGRYATSDGLRFVLSASRRVEGRYEDRIEVFDADSGAIERTVALPESTPPYWLAPSLSTDRYAAFIAMVLPTTDEGPHSVRIVDLEAGEFLDLELPLGEVRATP
jgi:hypothetical protein